MNMKADKGYFLLLPNLARNNHKGGISNNWRKDWDYSMKVLGQVATEEK